jgi:DNA-binding MarR family transcriptional regulator
MTVIQSRLLDLSGETRIERVRRDPDLGLLTAWLLDPIREELFAGLAERGHDRIRPCHRALLGYLDDSGARLTDLARVLGQPKQYVGRLVDELEALGYVQRRPDPDDRRSKLIVPTERGRDEQQQADLILGEIEDRHAARIGADRYADFRRLLRALALPDEDSASDTDRRRRTAAGSPGRLSEPP